MEPLPRYPLAPFAIGGGSDLSVGNLIAATLFTYAGTPDASDPLNTTVELEPDPLTGAWRVRWPAAHGSIIGDITAHERAPFHSVDTLHEAGLVPAAQATITFDRLTAAHRVVVHLAPPALCVPRNNLLPGALLLPGTVAGESPVYVHVADGEFTAAETMLMSPGQWLVGLHLHGHTVVVTCGGRVLGTLDARQSGPVREKLAALFAQSVDVKARAWAVDGSISVDVTRTPGIFPVRTLPPLPLPAGPEIDIPAAEIYEFADGSLVVTVDLSAAIDPEDWVYPRPGARTVDPVHPAQPAAPIFPEEPLVQPAAPEVAHESAQDAPTQYFPAFVDFNPSNTDDGEAAASETYLTEVEKVRLRRARRNSHGPKHSRDDSAPQEYTGRHRRDD
ncbi:hypothetical protein [Corynebacterium sp. p3-SID1194]|uniref:hypothetical protein n=1 Tax=Corynebacterium sp. p3-SID1194 TaxID=2916105 RepID=UPI0021A966F9|nr:hypothetical protein [Corynebacterium sp. p3-SID1194]MCT1450069.1 hypothetical protein [Corynebacterium sp. p3-SID1194]